MARRPVSTAAAKRRSQVNRKSSFLSGAIEPLSIYNPKIYECVKNGELGPEQLADIKSRLDGFMQETMPKSSKAPSTGATSAAKNSHEEILAKLMAIKKKLMYERDQVKAELDAGTTKYLQVISLMRDEIEQGEDLEPINEKFLKIQELSLKTDTLVDHYDYIKQVNPKYFY